MTTTTTTTASDQGSAVDYRAFDADNHYYEATDAYTRHIDKAMAKRAMQWAEINGRQRLLVGGKLNRFIPNPSFDPVAKPGSLDDYFRGKNPEAKDIRSLFGDLEPIRPEYRPITMLVCLSWTARASTVVFCSPPSALAWRKRSPMIHLHWSLHSERSTVGSRTTGVMHTRSGSSRPR